MGTRVHVTHVEGSLSRRVIRSLLAGAGSAEYESTRIETSVETTPARPIAAQARPEIEIRVRVGACSASSLPFGCHAVLGDVTTECARPGRRILCVD
jgi:hypothetical protein